MIPTPPSPELQALNKLEKELIKAYAERDFYLAMWRVFFLVAVIFMVLYCVAVGLLSG